jgi:predicted RNA-binding Zn ribbon-like protein
MSEIQSELFILQLANLKGVNSPELHDLLQRNLNSYYCLQASSMDERTQAVIAVYNIIRETLNAIILKKDDNKINSSAYKLFNFAPIQINLDSQGKLVINYHLDDKTEHDPVKVLLVQAAKELINLSQTDQLKYLRQCPARNCGKFFLAERSDSIYCSDICKKRTDYDRNAEGYKKVLKLRRSSGSYKPISSIRCKNCNLGIRLPRNPKTDKIDIEIPIVHCNHCHIENVNPYYKSEEFNNDHIFMSDGKLNNAQPSMFSDEDKPVKPLKS